MAKPRGLMLCLGRHAEHRAIVLMSCPCEASRAIACLGRGEASRLLLCLGRYAEHRALLLCLGRGEDSRPFLERFGWLSCGVMKRKRSGAKITSQVSADGRAESSPFQGGVRHGGIDAGKFLRRGKVLADAIDWPSFYGFGIGAGLLQPTGRVRRASSCRNRAGVWWGSGRHSSRT